MEIIIGYFLGAVVLVLFLISLMKMISTRINTTNRELMQRIDHLEERIEDLENK
ncbi:hypothetical protein [Gracilibacillus thailandensis]|uniref:hypothetical protein n=1 Tax=Gracilibacillus thailandensis TaxID=563735 RepID=UPI0013D80A0F|nr:hypothetical protein [Gracilibacillus thailandensis]